MSVGDCQVQKKLRGRTKPMDELSFFLNSWEGEDCRWMPMDVSAIVGEFRKEKLRGRMLLTDMWVVGNCWKKVRGRSRLMDVSAKCWQFLKKKIGR